MNAIVNLFTKEHGYYQKLFQFETIIIFIVTIAIMSKLFGSLQTGVYIIILITFGFYVTNSYVQLTEDSAKDINKLTLFKLNSLQEKIYEYIQFRVQQVSIGNQHLNAKDTQILYDKNKLNALYIDSSLIEFLYSIITIYDYNPNEFYLFIKGTNNILKQELEIKKFQDANGENAYPENVQEMFELAIQFKTNCMNNLQNFIYSVPKTKIMYDYVDNILTSYSFLINKHLTKLHQYQKNYVKFVGINNRTKFIYLDQPKGFNELENHSMIPNKNVNHEKIIDLYV